MESEEGLSRDLLVFAGSPERDVLCSKIFWKSLRLQPPLESRLVSGNMEQRLRPAGGPATKKNHIQLHQLEDLKTEYFIFEAQRKQDTEQRAQYLQKAKRREEIIMLLKTQRKDRIKEDSVLDFLVSASGGTSTGFCTTLKKKELVSLGHKPVFEVEKPRLTTPDSEILEDLEAVKKLD